MKRLCAILLALPFRHIQFLIIDQPSSGSSIFVKCRSLCISLFNRSVSRAIFACSRIIARTFFLLNPFLIYFIVYPPFYLTKLLKFCHYILRNIRDNKITPDISARGYFIIHCFEKGYFFVLKPIPIFQGSIVFHIAFQRLQNLNRQ